MMTVIVVEDEQMLRKGLVTAMPWAACDCEVVGEAENGMDALRLIEHLRPDILVTDIRMPGMSGLELIARANAIAPLEAIVISGYDEFEYAKTAIRLGVAGYLLKPIDDEEFVAILQKAVAHSRRMQKLQDALPPDAVHPAPLDAAMRYIDEHYREELTLGGVADAVFVSESYLSKLFRAHLDKSFLEYLTHTRVTRAARLIANGRYRVYEVAQMVGYRDTRYFYMVFKKAFGVTPKEYSNRARSGGQGEG